MMDEQQQEMFGHEPLKKEKPRLECQKCKKMVYGLMSVYCADKHGKLFLAGYWCVNCIIKVLYQ